MEHDIAVVALPFEFVQRMITFLALNTGAFTLIPITAMNFLNAAGVSNSFRVIVPTILATACASMAAVIAAGMLFLLASVLHPTLLARVTGIKSRAAKFFSIIGASSCNNVRICTDKA